MISISYHYRLCLITVDYEALLTPEFSIKSTASFTADVDSWLRPWYLCGQACLAELSVGTILSSTGHPRVTVSDHHLELGNSAEMHTTFYSHIGVISMPHRKVHSSHLVVSPIYLISVDWEGLVNFKFMNPNRTCPLGFIPIVLVKRMNNQVRCIRKGESVKCIRDKWSCFYAQLHFRFLIIRTMKPCNSAPRPSKMLGWLLGFPLRTE